MSKRRRKIVAAYERARVAYGYYGIIRTDDLSVNEVHPFLEGSNYSADEVKHALAWERCRKADARYRRRNGSKFMCDDCRISGRSFRLGPMLHTPVWRAIAAPHEHMILCDVCMNIRAEMRLGRRLHLADLCSCGFNGGAGGYYDYYRRLWNRSDEADRLAG